VILVGCWTLKPPFENHLQTSIAANICRRETKAAVRLVNFPVLPTNNVSPDSCLSQTSPSPSYSPGPGHYTLFTAFGVSVFCAHCRKPCDSSVCLVSWVHSHTVPCLSSRNISDVPLCLHSMMGGTLWCIPTTPAPCCKPSPGSFRKF